MLGDVALEQRSAPRASRRFAEARSVAESAGLTRHVGSAALGAAQCALQQGNLESAKAWALEAESCLRAVNHVTELARALCVHGLIACAQREGNAARAKLDEAVALAPVESAAPSTELGAMVVALRREMAGL